MEYASLNEVKDYIGIDKDFNDYDNKINIILDAINDEISDRTGNEPVNSRLKFAVCKTLEYNVKVTTGVASESDGDVQIKVSGNYTIPPSADAIISKFEEDDEEVDVGQNIATFL